MALFRRHHEQSLARDDRDKLAQSDTRLQVLALFQRVEDESN